MLQNFSEGQRGGDRTKVFRDIRQRVVQAGIDLFAAYGELFDFQEADMRWQGPPSEVAFLGLAGFGSPQFNGYLVLETNENLLRHCNATNSPPGDWMAELANQFLGRIKNGLLRDGIPIYRTPPIVVTGSTEGFLGSLQGAPLVALRNGQGCLCIWMKSEPATDEGGIGEPDDSVMSEGEMVLF